MFNSCAAAAQRAEVRSAKRCNMNMVLTSGKFSPQDISHAKEAVNMYDVWTLFQSFTGDNIRNIEYVS